MAITYRRFKTIPEKQQNRMIDIVFGINNKNVIRKIKRDLKKNGSESQYMKTLLKNITYLSGHVRIGYVYKVTGTVFVESSWPDGFDDYIEDV